MTIEANYQINNQCAKYNSDAVKENEQRYTKTYVLNIISIR